MKTRGLPGSDVAGVQSIIWEEVRGLFWPEQNAVKHCRLHLVLVEQRPSIFNAKVLADDAI
jgi:hypothetical protein